MRVCLSSQMCSYMVRGVRRSSQRCSYVFELKNHLLEDLCKSSRRREDVD